MNVLGNEQCIWLIRVGDGDNFRNSKYSFWGVKRGKNGSIKTVVTKIKKMIYYVLLHLNHMVVK